MRLASASVPGVEGPLTFRVHDDHDQYISESIVANGCWEPLETELIRRFLGAHGLLVDCGANIGWYSVVAATLGSRVIAFEPDPRNLALLHENLARNSVADLVEVHAAAVGATATIAALELSSENQGDHRLVATTQLDHVDVPVVRLADALDGRLPDVIKLDTQGSEVNILRGGRASVLRSDAVVILEFWPFGLEHCGSSAEELIGLLANLVGSTHRCFEIDERLGTLREVTIPELARMAATGDYSPTAQGHTNLLVVPVDSVARVADLLASGDSGSPTEQIRRFAAAERSECSQNGEDGVIELLVEATGCAHTFVEIGAGDGTECNSRLWRQRGWRVAAFDGDPGDSDWVSRAFVDADNINDLISSADLGVGVGVLTIDLDGNDFWILLSLDAAHLPSVLVVEYNATLGPVDALTVAYRPRRLWDHSNHFGASLMAFDVWARSAGYSLVYCESVGANAFFVRDDLLEAGGLIRLSVADAYRAPRYGWHDDAGNPRGHAPSTRAYVAVESIDDVRDVLALARRGGVRSIVGHLTHRTRTSDVRRLGGTWMRNRVRALRGGGPVK